MAAFISKVSRRQYPRIPTAIGFCMLISRQTISEVGLFDPIFGWGYMEESDYSQRAWKKGIEVVCCDDAFVYHEGSASFGALPNKARIMRRNQILMQCFWPDFKYNFFSFIERDPLREIRSLVFDTFYSKGRG